jgi:hypothetical protein
MVLEQIQQQVSATAGTAGQYTYLVASGFIVFVAIGALMWYVLNKRSYNIHVVIVRPRSGTNAFDWEAGYFGKHKLSKNKELRFLIYKAKQNKIQYNEEPIDQKYFIKRMIGGKYHNQLFMSPNSEGWLQPVKMDFQNTDGLVATVQNSDLTYYATELALMDQYFDDKDFFSKYGMFILVILSIVNACILAWAIYKFGAISTSMQHVADSLTLVANQLTSNTTAPVQQVIKIG